MKRAVLFQSVVALQERLREAGIGAGELREIDEWVEEMVLGSGGAP